jgi:rfaE bifunctional protein kinase chain/domain
MGGLSRPRLLEILGSLKGLRVMVIGDFALDAYWYVDMLHSELSRETPRFTHPITRETYSPGASGNICWNVKDIGVKEVLGVTVIGEDWRGKILQEELRKKGICLDYMVTSPKRVTPTYVKPILCGIDSQQEDSRLDFINYNPLPNASEEQLIRNIRLAVPKADAVIVEDQMVENAVVTDNVRENLIQLAEANPKKVFVADSRTRVGLFRNMVLKPNRVEAVKAIDPSKNPQAIEMQELGRIGGELQKRAKRPIYITLSEKGALLITESILKHLLAAPTKPPIDPVGAGDTFISALATTLAGGASPVEAGVVATLAAGVILKKLNITGTASPQEILTKFDETSKAEE